MLGPVFAADLRSHTRRPRVIILRILFVSVLLCLFILCYAGLPGSLSKKQASILSDFANHFVFLYMLGQFVFLLLIGPTYVAGAIAEERQRGTLDFLFSSNLTDAEIVYGKYFSRLALLMQFVLIGLPVLALVQLIGGVSLEMVAGMLLGTLGCLASLTALTLLLSVVSKHTRSALLRTFIVVVLVMIVWVLLWQMVKSQSAPRPFAVPARSTIEPIIEILIYLNPLYISMKLRETLALTGTIEGLPLRWFGICLLIHVFLATLLLVWAKSIVRTRFLRQIDLSVKRDRIVRAYQKPEVWDNWALYWKERYVQGGGSIRLFGWVYWLENLLPNMAARKVAIPAVLAVMVPLIGYMIEFDIFSNQTLISIAIWLAFGLLIASFLAALMRTTSGIASEKDRDTWDALVASPVKMEDILLSRVYGGLLSARWLFVSAIVLMAMLSFSQKDLVRMHQVPTLLKVLLFCLANLGYMVFFLGIGAFFSMNSNSSIRNVMSVLTFLTMLNLLPVISSIFFGSGNSTTALVEVLFFLTSPASIPVILGLGFVAMLSMVCYYKFPKFRWLYNLVLWMGNMLAINAVLLLIISGFTFAFGGYIPFAKMVLFVAPVMLDYLYYSTFIFPTHVSYYYSYDDSGEILFLLSSSVLFLIIGLLLYWWALARLKRTSGRVEYSSIAVRVRKRQTTAGVASLPSS